MKMHHHVNRTALAVLGLAVTMSSSAYAQFSTVSSRAAMNANDSVTWNSLGTDATNADLPINKTSTRGVLVTLSQTGSAWATVAISPGEFASWGFANGDVRLAFFNNSPVTLTFNPPVTAVGLNAGSVLSGPPFDFGIPIRAYRDGNLLGELSKSATINPDDTGAAPFFGVRDEGGISRVTIDFSTCIFCGVPLINQLSLVSPQQVSVDVKPGADKSILVADSNAKPPFAILSSAGFDASTSVDISSLRFGRTGTEASVLSCAGGVDVNYDFLRDLTCQFSVKAGAFVTGDLTATLKGKLTNGTPLYGTANVIVK